MSRQTIWPGDGLPLAAFRDGVADASLEAFEARFGRGFLVLSGLRLRRGGNTYITLGDARTTDNISSPTGGFTVFPIQKRPGAPFDFVSLGRASGNDLVVGDPSVSKFHAFLRQDGAHFVLQDGGSKNGTTANDRRVPSRNSGKPLVLIAGDRVKFGSVPMTFLLAEGLLELVHGLAHTSW